MEKMDPAPVGVGCFEVDEDNDLWEVAGYFNSAPDGLTFSILEMAFSDASFVVSKVPPEDWVAKVRRELTPVKAGRFTLHTRIVCSPCSGFGNWHRGARDGRGEIVEGTMYRDGY